MWNLLNLKNINNLTIDKKYIYERTGKTLKLTSDN